VREEPQHYSIFGADIQNYSGRHPLGQLDLRQDFHQLLREASVLAKVRPDRWSRQDQGDGELALVPGTLSKPRLVAELVRELGIVLDRYNHSRSSEERMRLRLAMHCGDAHLDGTGFAGNAPIVASRLLEATPLREALNVAPRAHLALILSQAIFDAVSGYRDIRASDFLRVCVRVKNYEQDAWLRVPGVPASALATAIADAGPCGRRRDGVERTDSRTSPERPDKPGGTRRDVVFQGPVSFGDGPVAGRDINFGRP
jgi:hypothetical protein